MRTHRTTTTRRRAALAALAAGFAVAAPLLGPAAPAQAAPGSLVVVDHNIEKRAGVLDRALEEARQRGAQVLTLQEVCQTDAEALEAARTGWSVNFTPSRPAGCGTRGDVGTMVVWRGAAGALERDYLLTRDGERTPHLTCLRFGSAPVRHVCSVHLVSEDPGGIRAQQTADIKSLTREWIEKGHLVVVGGDFNAAPGKPEMNSMFARGGDGRFVSAHELKGRAESTTDSGRHIDYVFFSANRAGSGGLQVIPTGSDHHLLVATTRWG